MEGGKDAVDTFRPEASSGLIEEMGERHRCRCLEGYSRVELEY